MDPEPDMIAEGKRRADAAGLENVSFVVGGSDDLEAVGSEIGSLAGAVIRLSRARISRDADDRADEACVRRPRST
jgi:hypothetical protein